MALFKILKKNSKIFPNKIALVIENYEYSYKLIYELVLQTIQNFSDNNFNKNSKVVIVEDNSLAHVLSLFALSYLNATVVPTGRYYSKNHLLDIIKITNANSIIAGKGDCFFFKKKTKIKNYICTEKSKKLPFFFKKNELINLENKKIDIKKDYIITMSSGSTSKPKLIIFSQKTKIIRNKLFKNLYRINSKDNIIVTGPIDHSLGMRTLFVPLLNGCTCVIMSNFQIPKYCELIKKYSITFSVLVANQLYDLINSRKYFKNFYLKKGLVSTSAKLLPNAKKKIIQKKIHLFEMYGAAEIGTVTNLDINKNKKFLSSVGKSYNKSIRIKILSKNNKFLGPGSVGEIICKTPGKFNMYHNSKELNKKAFFKGYFRTGDLGYMNKEKYLYFKSRVKNTIRRSGITIYPEDIEKAFINDKNIKEVAAIGKELKRKTLIFLFIIKRKDIQESYIRTICLKKLSTFQFPNKIIFLKKFPKTNLGKINKIKLLRNFRQFS